MSSSSSNEGNHNLADVLLYAESKLTRKQAIQEIGDIILKANMKPKIVKYALNLLKVLLPTENTLPSTVDELFGAMLSSENDWRLAQYLIKHKQRPSFLSTSSSSPPNTWNENSSSTNNSLMPVAAASSSSIPTSQEFNSITPSPSLFLPISTSSSSSSNSSSSSSSNSSNSSESESESDSDSSESDSSEDDDDDDDDDERNILLALQESQQQRAINSPSIAASTTQSSILESNINHNNTSDQRSQIVSSTSLNRFPFLGSFKRQRSETSSDDSSSEPDIFFSTRLSNNDSDDDDDDDETPFYPISNNNNNNKSCCFEMNGCDLLDGGKRRRQ